MPNPLATLARVAAPKPPRIVVHGLAGVGKTSFASQAPKPVFLCCEDGLGVLEVTHFPLLRSFDEVLEALGQLYTDPHTFQTVVLDSLDWLEPLIWARTCKDNGWASIEDAGYGRGYLAALALWRQLLEGLNALRDERRMTVLLLGHTQVKRFESPECDPYDRFEVKLHARAAALVQEHADVVGFATYRVATTRSDAGFNRKVVRALGSGERLLHLAERPAYLAKNRYALPDTLPLDWAAFATAMPASIRPFLVASSAL